MARQPDGMPSLKAAIRALQRDVARLQARSSWQGTGVSPDGAGNLVSATYVEGVSGYALTPDTITINTGALNTGDTSPSQPATLKKQASGFAPGTAYVTPVSLVTVQPTTAHTICAVMAVVQCSARNNSGSADTLATGVSIAGTTIDGGFPVPVANNTVGMSTAVAAATLTGVSTVTVAALVSTSSGSWTADAGNLCQLTVFAVWT